MLRKDGKRTARSASRMFSDPRVSQFHDPKRLVGAEMTTRTFAGWTETAAASMPADDPIRAHLLERARDAPMWDVYLFYGPDTRWTDALPWPASWIQHVGQRPDGISVGWIDAFARPLSSFDLIEETRRLSDAWVPGRPPSPPAPVP